MPGEPARIIYDTLHIAQFGVDVPIVRVEGMGDYFPVSALCEILGITSPSQLKKVQTEPEYAAGVETFTVDSAGGPQPTVCLRKREVAWWIGHLSPKIVQRRFAVTVDEFRQSLMDAADALWWGVRAVVPASGRRVADGRVEITLRLRCLRCHAPHRYFTDGHEVRWEIAEEEDR